MTFGSVLELSPSLWLSIENSSWIDGAVGRIRNPEAIFRISYPMRGRRLRGPSRTKPVPGPANAFRDERRPSPLLAGRAGRTHAHRRGRAPIRIRASPGSGCGYARTEPVSVQIPPPCGSPGRVPIPVPPVRPRSRTLGAVVACRPGRRGIGRIDDGKPGCTEWTVVARSLDGTPLRGLPYHRTGLPADLSGTTTFYPARNRQSPTDICKQIHFQILSCHQRAPA